MHFFDRHLGLYTDRYELTMAQGYFLEGRVKERAAFDYFFRTLPFGGGYVVFAGLGDVLDMLEGFQYDDEDREYIRSLGFDPGFVEHLSTVRFTGDVYAVHEGEIVFPNEPVLRVEAPILEAQLVETLILNVLNFESLVATKAARMRSVAGAKVLAEFGLRRAHGFGGVLASRAAVIGGFDSTSNLFGAHAFGLPSSGTQAHSWIESYGDELEAFRAFARSYPTNCFLLVDTYDTLRSGVPNAIVVAKEMEGRGERLAGIRLDSGDFAYLSKHARRMLDDAGLSYVRIVASNQIDEYVIRSLNEQQAPIDAYGVGTRLVTGQPDAALDGVYKLCSINGIPRMKISDDLEKTSLPGVKKVVRLIDEENFFRGDAVAREGESEITIIHHPHQVHRTSVMRRFHQEEILHPVVQAGRRVVQRVHPQEISSYVRARMAQLPEEHKRFENPHIYKVGITPALLHLRSKMIAEIRTTHNTNSISG